METPAVAMQNLGPGPLPRVHHHAALPGGDVEGHAAEDGLPRPLGVPEVDPVEAELAGAARRAREGAGADGGPALDPLEHPNRRAAAMSNECGMRGGIPSGAVHKTARLLRGPDGGDQPRVDPAHRVERGEEGLHVEHEGHQRPGRCP
eukprot:gene141-biopygen3859